MGLIASLLVFYPLIIPIWNERPLEAEDTRVPSRVSYLDDAGVARQAAYFERFDDPSIRSSIAADFAEFHNPKAVDRFSGLLAAEKDSIVQADILNSLLLSRNVAECAHKSLLWKLSASESPSVRAKAAVLFLYNGGSPAKALALLENERSLYVRGFVWGVLSRPDAPKPGTAALERVSRSGYPENRAGAAALLASIMDDPDKSSVLAKLAGDSSVEVRAALAKALAARASGGLDFLKKLASDTSATVRGLAATASSNPGMLDVLVELTKDPDSEVRRLAVLSLGAFKDRAAIDAVLKAFSDEALPVRSAAERAIAAISPGKEVLDGIGGALLDSPSSRASAVTALGLLNAVGYSEKITGILRSSDGDLAKRCVVALGRLKYGQAWREVAAKAGSEDQVMRLEVAKTLGVLGVGESFPVLSKLANDGDWDVMKEALLSMGRIGDSAFVPDLLAAAKRVDKTPCEVRSYACWGLARTVSSFKPGIGRWLSALALKKVVPTDAGKDYDADCVRSSAVLALIEMGKKSKKAKAEAESILKEFGGSEDGFASTYVGVALSDYVRQIKAYLEGKADGLKPTPVPTTAPMLTVAPIKKRKK